MYTPPPHTGWVQRSLWWEPSAGRSEDAGPKEHGRDESAAGPACGGPAAWWGRTRIPTHRLSEPCGELWTCFPLLRLSPLNTESPTSFSKADGNSLSILCREFPLPWIQSALLGRLLEASKPGWMFHWMSLRDAALSQLGKNLSPEMSSILRTTKTVQTPFFFQENCPIVWAAPVSQALVVCLASPAPESRFQGYKRVSFGPWIHPAATFAQSPSSPRVKGFPPLKVEYDFLGLF